MSSSERSAAKALCNAQHVPSDVVSARQVWGVIRVGTRDPIVSLVHVTNLPTAFRRPSLGLPSHIIGEHGPHSLVHASSACYAYYFGVSAEADGAPTRPARLTRRDRVTSWHVRRPRSRARDFPLTFPLQAYIRTLDPSKSREDRETGYVSLRSYR